MARKPRAKNTLSAGERVAIYEAEQAEKRRRAAEADSESVNDGENGDIDKSQAAKDAPSAAVAAKRELQRPQKATVRVDLSLDMGSIAPLHGMCNGPVSYLSDISHLFVGASVPTVRLTESRDGSGRSVIDLASIFRDPGADPLDEASYDFGAADKAVAAVYNSGACAIINLFDSSMRLYGDVERLIEVAVKVIDHYNGYFADGFAYGIKYFELLSNMLGDSGAYEIYSRLSRSIKLHDSSLSVGIFCMSPSDRRFGELVRYSARKRAPIDFVSLSVMRGSVQESIDDLRRAIALLKNNGYGDAELVVGEWSYIDYDLIGNRSLDAMLSAGGAEACLLKKEFFASQASVKGAAYALSFMLGLGDAGVADMACFSDAEPMTSPWCAISDRYGNPAKTFGAFAAYGELYRAGNRVFSVSEQTEGYAHTGIYAGAARDSSGRSVILISSFGGCGTVDLRIDGIPDNLYTADVCILDGVKDLSLGDSVAISGQRKRLILNLSEYGAVLIRLY